MYHMHDMHILSGPYKDMSKCFVYKTSFVVIKFPTAPVLRSEGSNFPER
jgi:hypothetical protein